MTSFAQYTEALRDFIARHSAVSAENRPDTEQEFNSLALAGFALQFNAVEAYGRLCRARNVSPGTLVHWSEIPPVPTAAFKELDLTSIVPGQRARVFHSSGTSGQAASRHFHDAESLSVYESSLLAWFRIHFLSGWPEDKRIRMILLAPPPEAARHSSLAHMLAVVKREFGTDDSFFSGKVGADGAWTQDLDAVISSLSGAAARNGPLALLGTAFSFVHLLDYLGARELRFKLPAGSRVMETGGYKGRSREVPKSELHALMIEYLLVPPSHIVCEYGMSELGSQAYQSQLSKWRADDAAFYFPPWARAQIISPETGREVAEGESGLLRVFDLANVRSVLAVQTEDLGIRRGIGFELLGRAQRAEPRGCSLMAP
jgi:hypothetical protein